MPFTLRSQSPFKIIALAAGVFLFLLVVVVIIWLMVDDSTVAAPARNQPMAFKESPKSVPTTISSAAGSSQTNNGLWCYTEPKDGEENSSKSPASQSMPVPTKAVSAEYCVYSSAIAAGPVGSTCLTRRDCVEPLSCIDNKCGELVVAMSPPAKDLEAARSPANELNEFSAVDAGEDDLPGPTKDAKVESKKTENIVSDLIKVPLASAETPKSTGKKCTKDKQCKAPGEFCSKEKCTLRSCETDKQCSTVSYCSVDIGLCQPKKCTDDNECTGKGAYCLKSEEYCVRKK